MRQSTDDAQISHYKYNINSILGKGSTGTVFLGVDITDNKKVAIKIIDMKNINNQVTVYLLENQKQALTSLNHPNIVSTYDIIQNTDYCYIIGEYCGGGTLYDLIKTKNRLDQVEALCLFRGIVNGYAECLKQGIIHRDIKPSNVLLHNGIPKIIDFGYSDIVGKQKPQTYYNVGSPSYMSPYQKSDIWSFGICLYEMLMGQVPFNTQDLSNKQDLISKLKFPSYLSIFCRQIIKKCLIPSVQKRIGLNLLWRLINEERYNNKSQSPLSDFQQRMRVRSLDNQPYHHNKQHSNPLQINHKLKHSPKVIVHNPNTHRTKKHNLNTEYFPEQTNYQKHNNDLISSSSRPPLLQSMNYHTNRLDSNHLIMSIDKQHRNQPQRPIECLKSFPTRPVSMNSNMFLSSHRNIESKRNMIPNRVTSPQYDQNNRKQNCYIQNMKRPISTQVNNIFKFQNQYQPQNKPYYYPTFKKQLNYYAFPQKHTYQTHKNNFVPVYYS